MPAGSNERISATLAVHGRMALKTCCSRMRRAMSWVYCPPKSRTTTPPNSDFGLALSFCIFTPVWDTDCVSVIAVSPSPEKRQATTLGNYEIQQLVRHINYFDHTLTVQVLSDGRLRLRELEQRFLRSTHRDLQFSTQLAVYLDRHLDYVIFSKVGIGGWPADGPNAICVTEHFPHLFGDVRSHGREH